MLWLGPRLSEVGGRAGQGLAGEGRARPRALRGPGFGVTGTGSGRSRSTCCGLKIFEETRSGSKGQGLRPAWGRLVRAAGLRATAEPDPADRLGGCSLGAQVKVNLTPPRVSPVTAVSPTRLSPWQGMAPLTEHLGLDRLSRERVIPPHTSRRDLLRRYPRERFPYRLKLRSLPTSHRHPLTLAARHYSRQEAPRRQLAGAEGQDRERSPGRWGDPQRPRPPTVGWLELTQALRAPLSVEDQGAHTVGSYIAHFHRVLEHWTDIN